MVPSGSGVMMSRGSVKMVSSGSDKVVPTGLGNCKEGSSDSGGVMPSGSVEVVSLGSSEEVLCKRTPYGLGDVVPCGSFFSRAISNICMSSSLRIPSSAGRIAEKFFAVSWEIVSTDKLPRLKSKTSSIFLSSFLAIKFNDLSFPK